MSRLNMLPRPKTSSMNIYYFSKRWKLILTREHINRSKGGRVNIVVPTTGEIRLEGIVYLSWILVFSMIGGISFGRYLHSSHSVSHLNIPTLF